MRDPFPMDLQRELATIAASVIETSASTEPALLSASAQTGSSPNQVLAMAIAKILFQRLSKEPSLTDMMLNGLLYEIGNRALHVLEKNDNTEPEVRRTVEEQQGVPWNDFLGADVAYLVGQWFRGEPEHPNEPG